jgi:hypothetical protein
MKRTMPSAAKRNVTTSAAVFTTVGERCVFASPSEGANAVAKKTSGRCIDHFEDDGGATVFVIRLQSSAS